MEIPRQGCVAFELNVDPTLLGISRVAITDLFNEATRSSRSFRVLLQSRLPTAEIRPVSAADLAGLPRSGIGLWGGVMNATTLSSRIEAVTVFSSGAKITRVAELHLEAGHWPERVRLSNLPLALEDDSLRARIEARGPGSGAVLPVAVDLRVELEGSPVDESLAPAIDQADSAHSRH